MLNWPKRLDDIAIPCNGNETFLRTCGRTFAESVRPELAALAMGNIPAGDLAWIEREFGDYHAAMGYPTGPQYLPCEPTDERIVPRYENTKRYERC